MAHLSKKAYMERQKNSLRRIRFDMPLGTKVMGKSRNEIRCKEMRKEIAMYA